MLTTRNEESLLCSFVPGIRTAYLENGVDMEYFNGIPGALPGNFVGRRFIAFVGTMNYYPNIDGCCWFAKHIFPKLRRRDPALEFLIIGKQPVKEVREIAAIDGVTVTGGVEDVRPFIAGARALVAPLRIARGIQNKVLECLAMGRKSFVSEAVARTFGDLLPHGVVECATDSEFLRQLASECEETPQCDPGIRRAACARFSWGNNLQIMTKELENMIESGERAGGV